MIACSGLSPKGLRERERRGEGRKESSHLQSSDDREERGSAQCSTRIAMMRGISEDVFPELAATGCKCVKGKERKEAYAVVVWPAMHRSFRCVWYDMVMHLRFAMCARVMPSQPACV